VPGFFLSQNQGFIRQCTLDPFVVVMGRGNSSDVYAYTILRVSGREFYAELRPTGAGGDEVPDRPEGLEHLFLGILWENLPFKERYRKSKVLNKNKWRFGTASYNGLDISQFMHEKISNITPEERRHFKVFEEWEKLSPEEQQPYIDAAKREAQSEQETVLKLIKEDKLPPLCELSVDNICNDLEHLAWRYIQCVVVEEVINPGDKAEVEDEDEDEDEDEENGNAEDKEEEVGVKRSRSTSSSAKTKKQKNEKPKMGWGRYHIILTHPKYFKGVKIFEGKSEGTTCYEAPIIRLPWRPDLHDRFPLAFKLRVNVMLVLRKERYAPNFLANLPPELFMMVVAQLGNMAHEETEVPEWERRLLNY
jgi:hypothetical protein